MNKIWNHLDHLSPEEQWGDSSKVSGLILLAVDAIRDYCGWKFYIHNAYALGGHAIDSYHYKGLAVDGHFDTLIPYDIQIVKVEEALHDLQLGNFMGVGIYPDWNNPGFHFDARGYKARWGFVGKYVSYEFARGYVI